MDEEKKYCELKKNTRMMKSQKSDKERNKLIEDDKRNSIYKIIN